MTRNSPKFKVGQVVRIDCDFYATKRESEQYQRITKVWNWTVSGRRYGFGYSFLNGDKAHDEKWLKPLLRRETGR